MLCMEAHDPSPDPSGPASPRAGSQLLRAVEEVTVDETEHGEANSDGLGHGLGEDIASWLEPVSQRLAVRWPRQGRTSERMRTMGAELVKELASAVGSSDRLTPLAVAGWFLRSRTNDGSYGPATTRTARFKQGVARAVFEEAAALGAAVDPHTAVGERIPRLQPKRIRPLTDPEADRVREIVANAPKASRQGAVVALATAGGTATNIAQVRAQDIDLDQATVAFAGNPAPTGRLDDWARTVLQRYLRDNDAAVDDAPLCVSTRSTPEREAESVSGHLRRVLRAADLYGLEGVSADSIRLHAARRVLDTDGIVAAARFLGWKSLDRTAETLGHGWRRVDG